MHEASAPASPLSAPSATPARGSKRSRSASPASAHSPGDAHDEDRYPKSLDPRNLSKNEKAKIARVCKPKNGSGKLEVPENIAEMWDDAGKGRQKIFSMWAKSGGVKASWGFIIA